MKRAWLLLGLVLICGCVSKWQRSYHDLLDGVPLEERTDLIVHEGEPRHLQSSDLMADAERVKSKGFVAIGYSAFNSASANPARAVQYGEQLGAAIVLTSSQYSHTAHTSISVPAEDTTIETREQGSIYAGGQTATYHGTSTTTIDGGTEEIPYSFAVYHHSAVYFVKRRSVLGVGLKDLPEEVHRKRGRRIGVWVSHVEPGSPAYHGDLFAKDIIMALNGGAVRSAAHFEELVEDHRGEEVTISVFRDGGIVERVVLIPR